MQDTDHGPNHGGDPQRSTATLYVDGELDMQTTPAWLTQAETLLDGVDHDGLTLDLAAVGFCDSTGLSMFVQLRNRSLRDGWPFTLAGVPRNVHRTLDVGGLLDVFTIVDDV